MDLVAKNVKQKICVAVINRKDLHTTDSLQPLKSVSVQLLEQKLV